MMVDLAVLVVMALLSNSGGDECGGDECGGDECGGQFGSGSGGDTSFSARSLASFAFLPLRALNKMTSKVWI